jgi:N utilization substance protein A
MLIKHVLFCTNTNHSIVIARSEATKQSPGGDRHGLRPREDGKHNMSNPIVQAIKQICDEKKISYEAVLETVEAALAAAYRKDFGEKNQNVKIAFDPESGNMRAFDVKTVVPNELYVAYVKEEEDRKKAAEEAAALGVRTEDKREERRAEPVAPALNPDGTPVAEEPVYNPKLNLSLAQAREIKKDAAVHEELKLELEIPSAFGRMAAMTAKQVITQRLREAERTNVYNEMKSQEGELVAGVVQRHEGRMVLVDLGRTTGVMPPEEQIPTEHYNPGDRVKVFVVAVNVTQRGPQVIVSRASEEIVRKLFSLEIPEVSSGVVSVHAVAREAGSRAKVAVSSKETNIDPIGSCIGQRGTRIQTIISELGGEKIDVIQWDEDAQKFIAMALAPAKVSKVELDAVSQTANVTVGSDQLSLAIGRGGQNVRLASRLSGWKINIVEENKPVAPVAPEAEAPAEVPAEEASAIEASAKEPAPETKE